MKYLISILFTLFSFIALLFVAPLLTLFALVFIFISCAALFITTIVDLFIGRNKNVELVKCNNIKCRRNCIRKYEKAEENLQEVDTVIHGMHACNNYIKEK